MIGEAATRLRQLFYDFVPGDTLAADEIRELRCMALALAFTAKGRTTEDAPPDPDIAAMLEVAEELEGLVSKLREALEVAK